MAASHDGGRLSTGLGTGSELLGKLTTVVWIGFGRWRLQRELWGRDVARLEQPGGS